MVDVSCLDSGARSAIIPGIHAKFTSALSCEMHTASGVLDYCVLYAIGRQSALERHLPGRDYRSGRGAVSVFQLFGHKY